MMRMDSQKSTDRLNMVGIVSKMIIRELKLKLNKKRETQLNEWLLICTSIYNWGIRKIELNANNKIYFSKFDFQNLLEGHSEKSEYHPTLYAEF